MGSTGIIWAPGKPLGAAVRTAREQAGLTQAQLARSAKVGLKFLYELESGKETLRADKVLDVLEILGLQLVVAARNGEHAVRQSRARYGAPATSDAQRQDYIGMACTTAGVSLRKTLAPDELVRALLTGKATPGKHAHFVVLLEEAPEELLRGLVAQVGAWGKPGVVRSNVRKIAAQVGVRLKAADWLKAA